jgi:isopenicillin-N N-acyltransferase-like protein
VAAILGQADLDDAIREAVTLPRPTATYLLIGHESGRAVGLELERERHCIFHPRDGAITHANHLEGPGAAGSLFERLLPDSLFRSNRVRSRLRSDGAIGEEEMRDALSDHLGFPNSICLHGDETAPPGRRSVTLAAIILDPKDRSISLSAGQPCGAPFTVYRMQGAGAA